jgi:hypothetical protein
MLVFACGRLACGGFAQEHRRCISSRVLSPSLKSEIRVKGLCRPYGACAILLCVPRASALG